MTHTARIQLIGLLVFVLLSPRAARAQSSSATPQTAGIPGSVSLMLGGTVSFSNGSQSITVLYTTNPNSPQPTDETSAQFAAAVSYDGSVLTFALPQQRFVEVNRPITGDQKCSYENGLVNEVRCPLSSPPVSPVVFSITIAKRPSFPCPDVQLPAGWNLVSGGLAQDINTNIGPFLSFAPSENHYQAITDIRDLQEWVGYLVYFDQPTTVFDYDVSHFGACFESSPFYVGPPPPPVNFGLTPGQLVMVGNPFLEGTVEGADAVWAYDPTNGYQETRTLMLGQGAWVYSVSGGTITITPIGS